MSYTGKEEATPSVPLANEHVRYWKADGYLYELDNAGVERQIASAAGSPGAAIAIYMATQFGSY